MKEHLAPVFALLLALAVPAAGCSGENRAPVTHAPAIELEVEFQALWWSEPQMEGLDPDAPPPKMTPVLLRAWEYTDPIGVPHPDTFDIVVRIRNPSAEPVKQLQIHATGSWRIGPQESESEADWEPPVPLEAVGPVDVAAHDTAEVRFSAIDLKSKQAQLAPTSRWPWEFKVVVSAAQSSTQVSLAQAEALLPIRLGD